MLKDIYNETITIFNKLRRDDSVTGRDVWHKTVIKNAAWYTDSARSAGGSAVYIGSYITILIPFENNYLPYIEWKKPGMQEVQLQFKRGVGPLFLWCRRHVSFKICKKSFKICKNLV